MRFTFRVLGFMFQKPKMRSSHNFAFRASQRRYTRPTWSTVSPRNERQNYSRFEMVVLYLIWLREKTSFTAETFQCEGCSRLSSTFFKTFSFATSFPTRLLIFDLNTWTKPLWNDISAVNRRFKVLHFMSNLKFCITVGTSSCMVHILSCRLMSYGAMTPRVLPFIFHFNDDFESKFTELLKKWARFLSIFVLISR